MVTEDQICKVPTFGDSAKDIWQLHNFVLRSRWESRWQQLPDTEDPGEDDTTLLSLRKWKRHHLIEGKGKVACLDCGKLGSAKRSTLGVYCTKWLHLPCAGIKRMPKVLRLHLDAGTFVAAPGQGGRTF